MLQAVITNQQLGSGVLLQQALRGLKTVGSNKYGNACAAVNQQRLVTHLLCRGGRRYGHACWCLCRAAIAARDNAYLHTQLLEVLHYGNHGWCFACAAGNNVAYYQHGYGEMAVACQSQLLLFFTLPASCI